MHYTQGNLQAVIELAQEYPEQGWEQFDEPVDRIVSIGAFEHFGHDRYPAFFKKAYDVLPDDGVMMLHTIVGENPARAKELGIPLTLSWPASSSSS